MTRKTLLSLIAVTFFVSLAGAQVDFDRGGFDIKAEIAASGSEAPEAVPSDGYEKGWLTDWMFGKKAPAEWTIMVYGNGKNDLEQFLMRDLNEMEKVGSTDKVNVIVEAGRIDGYDTSDGDWKGVRRYRMVKDSDTVKVNSPVIQDMGQSDMGDYKNVIKFVQWSKEKFPAKKYMLIFWNHGSGWSKSGERIITRGISYDQQSGNHINTPQMGQILKALGRLDVVGSDACLMQMAEVDYEIKDYVEYIVASEETEPGDGYTYDLFLGPVVANPGMSAFQVGKAAVDGYSNHYDSIDQGYTQSLVRAASVARLPGLVDAFAAAVMAAEEKDLAKTSRDATVNFAVEENRDLYDFTRRVVEGSKNADVKAKGQALMTFITRDLVVHNRTRDSKGDMWSGPKQYTLAKGIAAYFSSGATLANGYSELAWAGASKWDDFVLWMNKP